MATIRPDLTSEEILDYAYAEWCKARLDERRYGGKPRSTAYLMAQATETSWARFIAHVTGLFHSDWTGDPRAEAGRTFQTDL